MSTTLQGINGQNTFPRFVLSNNELCYLNPEWGHKDDGPFTLESPDPRVALISANDGRGTTDGSPCYRKFLAFSKTPKRRIITSYLAYVYTGPIKVKPWKPELKWLLADVDMEHYDITPDRIPDKLLERHLERIAGERDLVIENLRDIAQQTFFDILWNVPNR